MADDKLIGCIYCITNKVNGLQYIGQTTQKFNRRMKDHFAPSKLSKTYLGRAIKKYGKINFDIKIVEEVKDVNKLNKKEQDYIKRYNTLSPNGYNLTTGGERFNHTTETKKKISEAQIGRSCWTKGKELTLEHKRNISLATSGKKNSKETIEKMRKSRPNKRSIIDQNGKIYESIGEASRKILIHRSCIDKVLHGLRKTAGGYSFKYIGVENGR